MKKYLFSCAFSVALALFLFSGMPMYGNAFGHPIGYEGDLYRYDFRIAYAQWTEYDWENFDEPVPLYSGEMAPCLSVSISEDAYLIPDFYRGCPLPISVDSVAGTVSIPWGMEVLSDSVIGIFANRVDTVRWMALFSRDYYFNGDESDVMGVINGDGTVAFNEGNGFIYFGYEIHRTYKNRRLQSVDTVWVNSPVFEGLKLLEPNGSHKFTQVYYPAGINPLTPVGNPDGSVNPYNPDDPDDPETPDPTILPNDTTIVIPVGTRPVTLTDLTLSGGNTAEPQDWRGGSSGPIKPGGGWVVPVVPNPGGTFKPLGGGSGLDEVDLLDLLNRNNNLTSFVKPNDNLNDWKKRHQLQHGFGDGTCGFGRGGSGRPIKPGTGQGDGVYARGDMTKDNIHRTYVSTSVYMFQGEDEEQGKYVGVLNLYGTGQVNYFYLRDNAEFDFPVQPIGLDAGTGNFMYNYCSPTGRIDELVEGNTGMATPDSLTWGITVPNDPLNPIVVDDENIGDTYRGPSRVNFVDFGWTLPFTQIWSLFPYYYDDNRLFFTDGQQFNVPAPATLNISAVASKIDSALRGESSIGEVTDVIDKLLNATDKR